MPTVTAISRQKRNEAKYSIKIDGSHAFSLSDLDLSASDLRVGVELSDDEVEAWQRRAGESKAYDQALRYLGIRLRSKAELERYLARKGWEADVVDDTLTRLVQLGLVDDVAFAAAWVRERQLLRPRSIQALRFELMKLGVARDDIDAAVDSDGGDQIDTLVQLVERRQRQYPDRQKLMAYLARQGFRYDQIKTAFERVDENLLSGD